MKRTLLTVAVLFATPIAANAETDRERGFAICISVVPGAGAASLGHPLIGGITFAAGVGLPWLVMESGPRTRATAGRAIAASLAVLAVSVAEGAFLEPTEDFTSVSLRNWRPEETQPVVPRPIGPQPGVQAPVPAQSVFVRTTSGLQEAEVGRRVSVTMNDGAIHVGVIAEATEEQIVLTVDDTRVELPTSEIAQIYKAN